MPVVLRRAVPNDHSCLFYAVAYVVEGSEALRDGAAKMRELRDLCAADALSDPDPGTRALMLGCSSADAYADWIRDETHWGGENEILTLARHYGVEVAVVCCDSLSVLCYGSDSETCAERVYLLYTGQHYDPLVTAFTEDADPEEECRRFPKGDPSLERVMLAVARAHNEEAARRAAERRVKRLKCKGCGAFLKDADAFAAHCGEVEHDEDFAFECTEVDLVLTLGEPLPDGALDLSSEDVHTFYNTPQEPFAHSFSLPVRVGGVEYRTLEHYWQCGPYLGLNAPLCWKIRQADTPNDAITVAQSAGAEAARPDWNEVRDSKLLEALRAKVRQHQWVAETLLATGEKTIICIDTDPWAGMQAPGGIPTGQNQVGKALMAVRAELRAEEASWLNQLLRCSACQCAGPPPEVIE